MKKETVKIICDLMQRDVEDRRDRIMEMIDNGFDTGLNERIAEYRASLAALEDFENWKDVLGGAK